MIHEDTVCLLRECDAGARMGASSIEDVLSRGPSEALSEHLHASRRSTTRSAGRSARRSSALAMRASPPQPWRAAWPG